MVVEVMRNAPQVSMCTECKTFFNNKMFEVASLSLSLSQIGQGANPPKPSTSTSEFDDLKDPTSTYALLPSLDLGQFKMIMARWSHGKGCGLVLDVLE